MAGKMVEAVGNVKQKFAIGRNARGKVADLPRAVEIDIEFRGGRGRFAGKRRVGLRDDVRRAVVVEQEFVEMRGRGVIGEDEREGGEADIRERDELAREAEQRGTVERCVAGRLKCHGNFWGWLAHGFFKQD